MIKIFKILGTPSLKSWPGMAELPDFKDNFPKYPAQKFSKIARRLDKTGLDLLSRMLQYDPDKRVSAEAAMKHPYFQGLKLRKK